MTRMVSFVLITLFLICSSAIASPKMAVISTYSSASWLPADVSKSTCKMVDDFLADQYFAIVFDGTKTEDRRELARKVSQADGDCTVLIELRCFYDPPYTKARLASDIKPTDTVATVLMDYSVYVALQDKWIDGRIVQRSVFRDTNVPLDIACQEAVQQSLPKLTVKLDSLTK
ncbi:hypothetical protein SDC9_104227 [bioreactor metagenome]|uniref:DUF4136 domain-containing protein n=1 Tax=bioreactor metagenome TaxID=1076179 RepID=A0A645AVY3_9ZZZZ